LLEDPYLGVRLGEEIYKIRLAITSKGRGKSGGARIITLVRARVIGMEKETLVVLIDIYDKADVTSMNMSDIEQIVMDRDRKEEE